MTMIDTPEGIAFARAAARAGALSLEVNVGLKKRGQTAYSIVKDVYGLRGNRRSVLDQMNEYVEGTLAIRAWPPEYQDRIVSIVNDATDRAVQEYGDTMTTKDPIDANVQMLFSIGAITEQEGNDACLLIFTEVVRKYAGGR